MGWTVEEIPAVGRLSVLHTAAAGHGTAWAFGIAADPHPFGTLVFRRESGGWRPVEVPSIGRANRAVVCSPTELWVVGDGTSLHCVDGDWHEVPTADGDAQLFGLVAFGASLWTAGFRPGGDGGAGIVQRWDGTRWVAVALPPVGGSWGLAGLGGVAEDDLWTVGARHGAGSPVALHWDGAGWESVPVPLPHHESGWFDEVLALASDDVWAMGYRKYRDRPVRLPLVAHWDGVAWSVAGVPDGHGQLIEATVAGGRPVGVGYADSEPYVLACENGAWQRVPGPSVAERCSLHGATTLPDGRLLVVGATNASPSEARPYVAVLDA